MAGRGRELKVYLTSDVSRFGRGLTKAENRLDRFKRIAGGALAGVAAAAGAMAVKLGVDAVQAAIEEESAQQKLATALTNSTGATQDQIDAMEEYIAVAQRKSGLDDGALRRGVELLARATGDLAQAQSLATLSMDIAVQTGKDYETVAKAVGQAAKGSTGPLRRLGIIIGDGVDPIKELNRQFSGATAADAQTYAGGIRRVSTAFDELLESFGGGVLGGSGDATGSMSSFADTMYRAQPTAEALGQSVGELAANIMDVVNAAMLAKDALEENPVFQFVQGPAGGFLTLPSNLLQEGARIVNENLGSGGSNYTTGSRLDTYSASSFYNQTRYNTRANDATGRGDARGAQREARTRQRP